MLNSSQLSFIERLLRMEKGGVLDFTNATFENFIRDSLGIEIYEPRYFFNSGSKANRLRRFFKIESNENVCKLLEDFHEYIYLNIFPQVNPKKQDSLTTDLLKLKEIIEALKPDSICENIDYLQLSSDKTKTFELFEDIKSNIKRNPKLAIDRLHTLMIFNIRYLCDKHHIALQNDDKLDFIFKKYINKVQEIGHIKSEMTKTILKSTISILAKFHHTRNNESYAHANEVLNKEESLFIVNNIANLCKFISDLERKIQNIETKV